MALKRHTQPQRAMADFVLGTVGAVPSDEAIRAAGLEGFTYLRRQDHPNRNAFRLDVFHTSARHLAVRTEVARLLDGFAEAGIAALLFKGFYLAEFVFASPGIRTYADVDLLIRPDAVREACQVAERAGWRIAWQVGDPDHLRAERGPEYTGHEVAQLRHGRLDVTVDLHGRIVHNNHNRLEPGRAQQRLTRDAWQAASEAEVDGAKVHVLRPEDAVIFGLALNRCWGSDAWHPKPRDYLDFEALIERFQLTRQGLRTRARQLGVARTFDVYLRRCDPFRGVVDLAPPTWWERRWWNLLAHRERGPHDLQQLAMRAVELPTEAMAIARALPRVLRARRSVQRENTGAPTRPRTPPAGRVRPLGRRAWHDARRGTRRAARLLGVSAAGRDTVMAFALYHFLRRRGYDVRLHGPADATPPVPCLLLDGEPIPLNGAPAPASRDPRRP